jgi:hypothetical protein
MQITRQRRRVGFTLGGGLCLVLASGAILSTPDIAAQTPGAPKSDNIVVAAMNAPVVPDGDVAGRPTEFIVVLNRALDPQVEGRSLLRGKRIKVTLPDAFTRTNAPIRAPDSAILTKGWPQGGITKQGRLVSQVQQSSYEPGATRPLVTERLLQNVLDHALPSVLPAA